ncbi:MAG: periplasmic heavy metal sensor [Pseudomonadota bacterium]
MSEAPKTRLPIWLIVSLMANALLVGVMIGGGLGQKRAGPANVGPGGEQALIRSLDHAVPDEQRRAVRQAFRRAFAQSRNERVRLRDARRQLGQLLGADPYDADAVAAAFTDMREADSAMKASMHEVLAEQFGALSAEQRRAIIEDFNKRSEGRRGPRGDRPPPPRPFRDRGPGPD